MFAPLGLFKDVPCPQNQHCSLLTCIFSHKPVGHSLIDQGTPRDTHVVSRDTDGPILSAAKRIKLDSTIEEHAPKVIPTNQSRGADKARTEISPSVAAKKPQPANQGIAKPTLKSISKPVSPPRAETTPAKRDKPNTNVQGKTESRPPPRRAPKESLNPRMLTKAPAPHGVRLSIVTKLHAAMSSQNEKMGKDKESSDRYLVLSPNELVTMALDEEEKAAKDNPSIYSNVIKLRIVKLSKMSKDDWASEVKAHLNTRYYKLEPIQQPQKQKVLTTGLTTKEELAIVSKLITPLHGLEQFGYVTKPPTEEEVSSAEKGVVESKGWEKCDRCGGRFQVFPGRREDGSLTTGGQCTYHPGKPIYPPRKQTDHITGPRDTYYSCCNESIGTSSGCTKGNTHVFKVSETKRLASVLQFEKTPEQSNKGSRQPVCFDCEMGYTTMGLELIRLTAVSWPQGKQLLDVLVRPMGEVLDLNSRFSGVFPEHYANAIPYGTPIPEISDGEATRLHVVESPTAARALLFELIQPDTPLIGHAIDNDLNACRIIHPTIIDTVILYPHPRGLPIRMSLKALCKKHLDRDIQTGGNRGHDSKEDAIATGDLVRVKASETWKTLKAKGWQIEGGRLVPPPGAGKTEDAAIAERTLGPGAGQKRKDSALGEQ
ncbi:hypothetical protein ASPWEDRAFT_103020 [Aspergillus wentii DTO 134E9]|uniref:RNA exonuclease 3 n=1 Tax=Aspergillus wentii DTO 134E9 TaxID=1073089 RepID=A0A1L9RWV9_ASPWE|nr:uncharacterized protein ASPWEDRAFT_103020 [Aspergillus wentii DTO 134E9]KAI9928950.1 RNA exonuclease 3 [Aspergillus wentii]OJJ39364.1 hypothetical protein ASPWEDRAFT_103020 [Aspergillus wentii DTO 134E9]